MTKTGTEIIPATTAGKLETATTYHLMCSYDTKAYAYINTICSDNAARALCVLQAIMTIAMRKKHEINILAIAVYTS